jgi:hypothetical protein
MNLKQKSISFEWHAVEYELKTKLIKMLPFRSILLCGFRD